MFDFLNKETILSTYHNITKHLSLLIIAIIIGISLGFKIAGMYLDYRVDESIKLQGFIHEGVIYDIRPRI